MKTLEDRIYSLSSKIENECDNVFSYERYGIKPPQNVIRRLAGLRAAMTRALKERQAFNQEYK